MQRVEASCDRCNKIHFASVSSHTEKTIVCSCGNLIRLKPTSTNAAERQPFLQNIVNVGPTQPATTSQSKLVAEGETETDALSWAKLMLPIDAAILEHRALTGDLPHQSYFIRRESEQEATVALRRDRRVPSGSVIRVVQTKIGLWAKIGLSKMKTFKVDVGPPVEIELTYALPAPELAFAKSFSALFFRSTSQMVKHIARELTMLKPERVLVSLLDSDGSEELLNELAFSARSYMIFHNNEGDRDFFSRIASKMSQIRQRFIVLSPYDPEESELTRLQLRPVDDNSMLSLYLSGKTIRNWKNVYRQQTKGNEHHVRCHLLLDHWSLTDAEIRSLRAIDSPTSARQILERIVSRISLS